MGDESDSVSLTARRRGGASSEDTEAYSVDSYCTDPDYVQSAPSDLESSSPSTDYESLYSFYNDEEDDDLVAGAWNALADPFSDVRPHPVPEFTSVPGFNPGQLPNFTVCIDM
jgi:hypothetical protein